MCIAALPAIGAALSIASSAVGYMGAAQQAKQQNEYYVQNAQAANIAAGNQYAQLQHREIQQRDAASRDMMQMGIEGLKARGTAQAAAGEAGVTGLSVDALMGSFFAAEGQKKEARSSQFSMDQAATYAEMDTVKAQTEARINSVQRADSPSFLPFLISGLSGAVGAFKGV
jgi:hypothetical protein